MNIILYIKENHQFGDLIVKSLANEFTLLTADYLEDGLKLLVEYEVDVIIIDCEFIESRIEMCKTLRNYFGEYIPILIATSTDCHQIIQNILDAGADSYLNMVNMHPILRSKLGALIRFKHAVMKDELRLCGLNFDNNELCVAKNGIKVDMKRREYQILNFLVTNQGIIISRERIADKFWEDKMIESNTIDVHITRIRQKLNQLCDGARIETVYGLGYKFVMNERD